MITGWIFQKYLRKLFPRIIKSLPEKIMIKIQNMIKYRVQTNAVFFIENKIPLIQKLKKNSNYKLKALLKIHIHKEISKNKKTSL